jgi:hypothetical protein
VEFGATEGGGGRFSAATAFGRIVANPGTVEKGMRYNLLI